MDSELRRVVIAGCGRLGAHLAGYYSGKGLDVVIIDVDESAFSRLDEGFSGFAMAGSVAEFGLLKKAGLERADLFVAVTERDALNIMCAEIAQRHFKVPRVFARVYEPSLEEFCNSLGISAVSPIMATAERFLGEIERSKAEGSLVSR